VLWYVANRLEFTLYDLLLNELLFMLNKNNNTIIIIIFFLFFYLFIYFFFWGEGFNLNFLKGRFL